MKITDEMVKAASAVVPSLSDGAVRQMLEAALAGQIVMGEGDGQVIEDGKSRYPDYMTIYIKSTYKALDLARQLIATVQDQPAGAELERPAMLLVAGTAAMSFDD